MTAAAVSRGIASLAWLGAVRTRQISPENPTGARNAGARALPNPSDPSLPHSAYAMELGAGFKVRPFISVGPGESALLADIAGAGVITNFWITSNIPDMRELRLRIFWDGSNDASVDVTLASFFCLGGPGQANTVVSTAINVGPTRGCSSSWSMPFTHGAKLELQNTGSAEADVVAYKITYEESEQGAVLPGYRFHAKTVHGAPHEPAHEFDLLTSGGEGLIVGTSVNWTATGPRWWGEGEVKVYLGDDEFPTLVDTGTEDYFGGAWGFGRDTPFLAQGPLGERSYLAPYTGVPYLESNEGYPREIVLYRWHIHDPIGFDDGVRMSVQVIGHGTSPGYEKRDDVLTGTGYWYAPLVS
jgi:hypothetical protein